MSNSINLPDSIYNSRQILQLRRDLEQLSEQLQRGLVLSKLGLAEQNESTDKLPPLLLELLRSSATPISIADDVPKIISAVDDMTKWPTIRLTLATPAEKAQRLELVHWWRSSLSPELLFQFSFDPELIGGLIVRTPVRQYDWSFRSRLLANASDLQKVISHVGQ